MRRLPNIPGVTLGQLCRLAGLLDSKPSRPITALQILETVDGNPTGSRSELQQPRLLLSVPAANALPEVLDDLVVLGVATVVGVLLPVIDINVGNTTDEEFELALVKDVDKIWRNEFVEPADERIELFIDALLDAPFGDETVFC